MPNNANVNLDVRNWASNGSDGYTTSQNNGGYSYRFTGGTETADDGSVVEHGRGVAVINLALNSDSRYAIVGVNFRDDANNQLSSRITSPTRAQITDANSMDEVAEYIVNVRDGTANVTFECDPAIRNVPN